VNCDRKYGEFILVDEIACKLNQTCLRLTIIGQWNLLMDSNIWTTVLFEAELQVFMMETLNWS